MATFTASNIEAPLLSIVIPAHEAENLHRLHLELSHALALTEMIYEIILVDDGSRDATWEVITALSFQDRRVKGLRLSRNFGHQYALFAGISAASGQAVITMDADLQHPPTVIPELLREWRKGVKIVHTVRLDHDEISWSKKFTSKIFYKVFSFLSGVHLSAGMADFRLLDRQVVNELLRLKEGALFLRGLVHWIGYSNSSVPFQCGSRSSGVSKYNFRRMLKFAWTGITSFSIIPLRMATIIGLLTSLVAFYQLIPTFWAKFVTHQAVPGWASIIGLQSLLFGVLFFLLGIQGEYMARILEEVRQRPRFIVSESRGFPDAASLHAPMVAAYDRRMWLGAVDVVGLS
ncbi:MAG: glycosyltransferase family 2 protein [Anaerolineae bacterium]|nr:glycosyltransferase family 2 protein [Anaerolineae bacterium]